MQCQLGAWLSAFGKGRVSFGACHGIGNVLHEMMGVAHSMTTCVLLPTCLEWNRPILGERYLRIAHALNVESDARPRFDGHARVRQVARRAQEGRDAVRAPQDASSLRAHAIERPL